MTPIAGVPDRRRGVRGSIESALLGIAARWQLSWENVADYRRLGIIEAIAHELAHALDLGSGFEAEIRTMGDARADDHEARAIRIELAALDALGVHLSARRLWVTANWRDPGIPIVRLRAALDRREQSCVARFVALVRREIESEIEADQPRGAQVHTRRVRADT